MLPHFNVFEENKLFELRVLTLHLTNRIISTVYNCVNFLLFIIHPFITDFPQS
jgi:hypothetical protein